MQDDFKDGSFKKYYLFSDPGPTGPESPFSTGRPDGGSILDELGIAGNTIVVYSTDNGAETVSWPDGGITPFKGEAKEEPRDQIFYFGQGGELNAVRWMFILVCCNIP